MRRILAIVLTLVLVASVMGLPAATAASGTRVLPLMAGRHMQVGTVTLGDDGTQLSVTFDITMDGWFLQETHVYVGTRTPRSAPGSWPYKHSGIHATSDTFSVPIADCTAYKVAAHAEVVNENNVIAYDCPTVEELCALLPASGGVWVERNPDSDTYWDMTFSNAGILDGTRDGWCIDMDREIEANFTYAANFYCGLGSIASWPGIDRPENLDLVNWVVNNREGYGLWEVSRVIWRLIDFSQPELTAHELELYNGALAYGEGFVPDISAGDVLTVIVSPVTADPAGAQCMLAELGAECTPIYQTESAWGIGTWFGWMYFWCGWGGYITYWT